MVALEVVEGGTAVGVVSSGAPPRTRGGRRPGRGGRGRRPRRRPGRGRRAAARARRATTRRGSTAAAETSIGVFERLVDGPRRGPRRPAAPLRLRLATTSPRSGSARRPACAGGGCSRRARSSSTSRPRTSTARRGRARRPPTSPTSTSSRSRRTPTARLEWGRRRVSLPAGRYETLLPPSAVSDFLLMLAWSMGGRPAQEGRSAFAGPDGPRVGERLTDLPAHPGERPGRAGPGVRAVRHRRCARATGSASSTTARPRGASSGCATARWASWPTAGPRPPSSARRSPLPATTCCSPAGRRRRWRTWSPRTERGLLLTCLWYIREVDPATLLLTGLTRDGVYLVENGEVVAEVDHNFRFNHSPAGRRCGRRPRSARPSARCRASGRTGSPGWPCPRCGCRSSTCRRCRRAAGRPRVTAFPIPARLPRTPPTGAGGSPRSRTSSRAWRDGGRLQLGPPFEPGGECSWVAPAVSAGHGDVVLKVGWVHDEARDEAAGLRVWNGHGAVRLLDAFAVGETSALLLEPATPGTPLSTAGRSGAGRGARRAAAAAVGRPQRRPPVPPAAHDVDAWIEEARPGLGHLDPGLVRDGLALFGDLPAGCDRRSCWPRTCTRRTCSPPAGSRGSSSTRSPTSVIPPTTWCSTC